MDSNEKKYDERHGFILSKTDFYRFSEAIHKILEISIYPESPDIES